MVTNRELYDSIIAAYQNCKDKKQGAKKALEIYENNIDLIEAERVVFYELDSLVDALRGSLNIIVNQQGNHKTQITRHGPIISKLIPCGKNCNGCPHGPYLYKVSRRDGKLVWHYLGSAKSQSETKVVSR